MFKAEQKLAIAGKLKRQGGFGMVEMGIVLIIVAIAAGAAYVSFQNNTRKTEVNTAIDQVTSIAAALRKNFGSTNKYGELTTAIAVQSRAIPNDLRIPGTTTAQNSYGGMITATPTTLTQTNDAALLVYNNVPQSQCVDIVIGTETTGRRIRVNNVVVKPTDGALVMATLTTQCETADLVPIEWAVGRTGA